MASNIKLSQLNAFRAIVECKTVTAASDQLSISQPAVSRLLSGLEEQIGFQLFNRTRNSLTLSDEGQAFYLEVAKVFDVVSGLTCSANAIKQGHFGSLNIAAMPLLSNAFLPRILATLIQHAPQLKVSFKTYRSEEVIRQIQSQTTDIGFALVNEPIAGVLAQRIECQCVCLIPASFALSQKKIIDVVDIAEQRLIRHEKDNNQRHLDNLFRRYNLNTVEQVEVSLANTAAALVREGVGLTITDPFTAIMASEHSSVVMRPLAFNLTFQFDILYPALRPIHRYSEQFIEQFVLLANDLGIELKISAIRNLSDDIAPPHK
ncbi:transcriptional regulator [Vibrio sp. MACH09]|nr:transcriptional regulator [Vibrio sp. MACH09]